jgi:predicted deacylase
MAPATPTTAVTQPPVVLATAAALPSPTPDALPVPSAAAASDAPADGRAAAIGFSAGGRPLTDYQFGSGPNQIALVGGMHGGYEWNTILLAYRLIDYFTQNPDAVPETVTLHIIPAANPDGQFAVAGRDGRFSPADVDAAADNFPGRFNGNGVDLNRNWDCQWQPAGKWRDQEIDAGEFPFSEPETAALRDFFLALQPTAVVFWHSAANGVYGAGCPDLYQPAYDLTQLYGSAAGYPVYESFDSYEVTGDASDWLALQGIPAITVELETHEALDWEKNLAGVTAVFGPYVSDE